MVFKCQEDSFLKEFTSKVVACEKAKRSITINGKKEAVDGYEVILEDTVMFPEGGGQPCDYGTLNDKQVLSVTRSYDKALHFVQEPFNIGEDVKQKVNWNRRFDHMQQHSGQHLLSAVLERDLMYVTASWYLGEEEGYIELSTPSVSEEEIRKVENICNEYIREARPVTVEVLNESTPPEDYELYRSTRGLPADHKGDIRIIKIEGVDMNMCCGTHVANLSQLQVVKLLDCERSKRKDHCLLHFIIGNRVINRLQKSLEREQKLNGLLKTNTTQHVEFVDKLIQNQKLASKNLQVVLKELAVFEANKLKVSNEKYFIMHKKEADETFMNVLIKELGRTDILLFLSIGDPKGCGSIILYGDEKAVSDLGPQICTLLEGKGAGKGNRFQAKVNKLSQHKEAEKLVKNYFI